MLVYYAFLQSIIEYGCEIFGHRYKTNSKMIEAMQVKAMKVIFGANCDVKKVMKNRGILSFRSLVNYKTYQFMYKAKQNVLPLNLLSLFCNKKDFSSRHSKFNCNFKVNHCNSHILSSSLSTCGIRLWNCLPTTVKETNSFSEFKRFVKQKVL